MNIERPAVSVIIPCRAADDFIGMQLRALAAQVEAPLFEVVLVDNGRNENLAKIAALSPYPAVRIVAAHEEAGTGFARNVGIAQAAGELLLFCDADDVVTPTWVRDGAHQLQEWPAFSGGAVPFDASIFRKTLPEVWNELHSRIEPVVIPLPPFGVGDYPILLGCSFGMTRDVALQVGGFDRSFGTQAEDNDLGFRLRELLGFVPAARHIAVAYRTRAPREATFKRGYDAGMKHAMLCARHSAWTVSPSYQGKWVLRGCKEVAVRIAHGQRPWDSLGRHLGTMIGRVRFRRNPSPAQRLGLTTDGTWGVLAQMISIPLARIAPAA